MPPILATAEANPERDMPIPIPPCMIGTGIFKSPIFNEFKIASKFSVLLHQPEDYSLRLKIISSC